MALIEIDKLSVDYRSHAGATHAVRDVSFEIGAGEFVGLVGESGSGKSTLGNAIIRLLPSSGQIVGGSVRFDGEELATMDDDELQRRRWRDFSTVFQGSMNSLNPVITIDRQFRDVMQAHTQMSDDEIHDRTAELLRMVEIDPSFMRFYQHELSGGMKQRVAIALALALSPKFVLLDEPTTGLDVVVQKSILENLRRLQKEQQFAVLIISHDLGAVLNISDRMLVMYAGEIVEEQPAKTLLQHPIHPYTRGLLGSYADPTAPSIEITYLPGKPPDLKHPPRGCPFSPRCSEVIDVCWQIDPPLAPMWNGKAACHVAARWWETVHAGAPPPDKPRPEHEGDLYTERSEQRATTAPVLQVNDISKSYRRRRGRTTTTVQAVQDVSFSLERGRVTALVGQSGSGKTTIARLITGVEKPDSGNILFGDTRVDQLRGRALRKYRKHVQLVFQDPFSALNPAHTILHTLIRPLRNYLKLGRGAAKERARELLRTVGLAPVEQFENRYPHQLSGGQQQRVIVARALAAEPEIIIADEPTSMLDVSIRAEILQLLDALVRDRQLAMLYITHDLLSARLLADEILVLHEGHLVEQGPANRVIRHPEDAYTRVLLNSVPNPFVAKPPTEAQPAERAEA